MQVKDVLLQKFNIKQPVIFVEFDVDNVLSASLKEEILYTEIPQFPVVERDLSIVMDNNTMFGNVASSLNQLKVKFLEDFNLFDIYEGDKIGSDKKSFAINFRFLKKDSTLTDAEVEAAMKIISDKLVTDFNAAIRQ